MPQFPQLDRQIVRLSVNKCAVFLAEMKRSLSVDIKNVQEHCKRMCGRGKNRILVLFDGFIQKMVDFVPKLSPNHCFDTINYVIFQINSEAVWLNLFACGFLLRQK